jgi:hypothetical protein
MQDTIRFEDSKRLDKRHTGMEPPPFAGVTHPVDIEAVRTHTVDPGEGRVELLATLCFIPDRYRCMERYRPAAHDPWISIT